MAYTARIKKVSTGEIREVNRLYAWDDENDWGEWSEGNFSCDCNRGILFESKYPWVEGCSEGKYLVQIVLDDGSVTLDEFTHGHGYWP